MSSRDYAIASMLLLLLGPLQEVYGHYSLGFQGVNGPEAPMGNRINTLPDGHKIGHIAYVLPGSLYVPPSLQDNNYSPNGSVIVDTSGDLYFYINISSATGPVNITWESNDYFGRWLYIAIPPEFTPPKGWDTVFGGNSTYVSSSITNDRFFIETGKFHDRHPMAPSWWYIRISAPHHIYTGPNPAWIGRSSGLLYPADDDPWQDRQVKTGPFRGCYRIVAYKMKAPPCSGKYFFKVFYTSDYVNGVWENYTSFPPENYPVILVKGEVDPGYISGRIRYAGHSQYYYGYYYGSGIRVPGKVVANGTALDPVTNQPTGRPVCGVGFFNSTAEGYYEIEGLAPGIYTLTAYASGLAPRTLAAQVTVKRGQSLNGVDIYLYPGAKIQLRVYSKCPTGPIDWPNYVTFGYNNTVPLNPVGNLLATYNLSGYKGFPWGLVYLEVSDTAGRLMAYDYQYWNITANPRNFTVLLGDPACYSGVSATWDGHVPDDSAYFTSGLPGGTYYVKANIFGYVQPRLLRVEVPSQEFAGATYAEIDLMKGGTIKATVHFHDQELPSTPSPPPISGDLIMEAFDSTGKLRAWNFTSLAAGLSPNVTLTLIGESMLISRDSLYGLPEDTFTIKVWYPGYLQQEYPQSQASLCGASSLSFHLVKGGNITGTLFSRDCEDPSQPVVWQHPGQEIIVYAVDKVGVAFGGNTAIITQVEGESSVAFSVWGWDSTVVDYLRYNWTSEGLPSGFYHIEAYTVGYFQTIFNDVWVQKGTRATDIPVYVNPGATVFMTVDFKTEFIPTPLKDDFWSYYFRIEAYDEDGHLAAANITAVEQATTVGDLMNPAQPQGVQAYTFQLDGFNGFTTPMNFRPALRKGYHSARYSKPDYLTGDYLDYGIPPGTYTIIIKDETEGANSRYVQTLPVTVTVRCMSRVQVVLEMDERALVGGDVLTRNWLGDYRAASWLETTVIGDVGSYSATGPVDGEYWVYLSGGDYEVTVELKPPGGGGGYVRASRQVAVAWASRSTGLNFYLEESGIPVPEFHDWSAVFSLLVALLASILAVSGRRFRPLPNHVAEG
ncbi:carboxypeptidase regulatory-like domain-containing protein [Candidatus Bathyarchaeota archaeon]|nr:carboxypeptidase regulatory-like domain-containing protein [Candidatus Bathyarchaeota archaeon]